MSGWRGVSAHCRLVDGRHRTTFGRAAPTWRPARSPTGEARWGFGSAFSANQKSGRTWRSAGAAQFFLQGQSITAAAMKAFDRVLSIFGIVSTWPTEIVSSRTYCRCRPHFAHCNRRTNQKTRKCRPRFAWFAIAVARGSLFESPAGSAETKRRPLGWE